MKDGRKRGQRKSVGTNRLRLTQLYYSSGQQVVTQDKGKSTGGGTVLYIHTVSLVV